MLLNWSTIWKIRGYFTFGCLGLWVHALPKATQRIKESAFKLRIILLCGRNTEISWLVNNRIMDLNPFKGAIYCLGLRESCWHIGKSTYHQAEVDLKQFYVFGGIKCSCWHEQSKLGRSLFWKFLVPLLEIISFIFRRSQELFKTD